MLTTISCSGCLINPQQSTDPPNYICNPLSDLDSREKFNHSPFHAKLTNSLHAGIAKQERDHQRPVKLHYLLITSSAKSNDLSHEIKQLNDCFSKTTDLDKINNPFPKRV